MLTLEIGNTSTRLSGMDPAQHKSLSDLLSFEVEGAAHSRRFMPGGARGWDGKKRLLKRDGSFPAGMTLTVGAWLKENELKAVVRDLRGTPAGPSIDVKMIVTDLEPRPFQLESTMISADRPRGIYVIGTGGGKSITAAMIIAQKQIPTLFIVPDKGLRSQTLEVFQTFLGDKYVGGDIRSSKPIIVTNIHQIAKCEKKDLDRFRMLMIDEFHRSASLSYLRLNLLAANCYYRYGFTGTPIRTDGRDMVMNGVLSNVLLKKTTSDLIVDGYLVPPRITMIRYKLKNYSKLNYRDAYGAIVNDNAFNVMVAELIRSKALGDDLQTLVLVRQLEHGQILQRMVGDDAVFLSGSDSIEEREMVKKRFAEKKIRCMIATNIFGEGQDIRSIDCLVNVRLQESEIQTKQGVGRALRLAAGARTFEESKKLGKSHAEIFDFMIEGNKHLKRHSMSRESQYRSEPAFKVEVI